MTSSTAHQSTAATDDAAEHHPSGARLARVLVCLDASEPSKRALAEAIRLAGAVENGLVTGFHAYAAKLHDSRFRQMEGGLPERYRKEQEIENQRAVHDSLITSGLTIISGCYQEFAAEACQKAGVAFARLNAEGKNYQRIVEAASSGEFDVLALGSVGLGRVQGATIGTVCERVCRRSPIETLVVRDPRRAIGDGPVVVGLDGSPRSYGALLTAFAIARACRAPLHAVAAYDPHFHYVAFNKISDALSEEAAARFRFKEQERLHEEIIDSGIARIYRSHLEVAKSIADANNCALETRLLEGKPWRAIMGYLNEVGASLVVVGRTGIHADPQLDIGGNAENLVRTAPCSVWLGHAAYTPPLAAIAHASTSWTEEAEAMLERVPEAALAMVRLAILRVAQETGHTVITTALVKEATERFCPSHGGGARSHRRKAPRARAQPLMGGRSACASPWTAAALARIARVPKIVRAPVRRRTERLARAGRVAEIDAALVEQAIESSRAAMGEAMREGGHRLGIDRPDQET